MKKQAGVTFTEVTLEEMRKFMRNAYHALHPKEHVVKGEVVFDLFLSNAIGVRVYTSIGNGQASGAGLGQDAIRIVFFNFARNIPLVRGSAPIVKRTQNWRDNLSDRIEDCMEMYDTKEADLEAGRFVDWSKKSSQVSLPV